MLDHKDIDFAAPPIEFERVAVTRSHGLWLAVVASFAMHILLVLIIPLASSPPVVRQAPQKIPPRTVHVTFFQVVPQKEVATIEAPDASVPTPAIINEPEIRANDAPIGAVVPEVASEKYSVNTEISSAVTEPAADENIARPWRYRPLSSQEMSEISASQNTLNVYSNRSGVGRNVFHPSLRAQLNALEQQPTLARVEDAEIKSYKTGAGEDRVELKDGSCLVSSDPGRDHGPRNWYMTRCGGKSESEKITDRINEAVNERFNRSR